MSDLSFFKLDSETITIKDSVARQTADNAKTIATTTLNKVYELEKLSRVSISYDSATETMTITTGTHDVA